MDIRHPHVPAVFSCSSTTQHKALTGRKEVDSIFQLDLTCVEVLEVLERDYMTHE